MLAVAEQSSTMTSGYSSNADPHNDVHIDNAVDTRMSPSLNI